MKIKLLVDDAVVIFTNYIKIIVEDENDEDDCELHLTLTHERLISDLISPGGGNVEATNSQTYVEMMYDLEERI